MEPDISSPVQTATGSSSMSKSCFQCVNLNSELPVYICLTSLTCKTEEKNGISHLISELLRTLDSSLRDRLFVLQNEVF